MDVTQEVQRNHIIYGASDYTAPSSLVGSKSLNFAKGPSLSRPDNQACTVIPQTFNYESAVGLFGVENYFTKISVNVIGDALNACYSDLGYECAMLSESKETSPGYVEAVVDRDGFPTVNTYEEADIIRTGLPLVSGTPYISVELNNKGVGNMYTDDWLDVRLYTADREEHPYNKMYVKLRDTFYIGFHARNTKRLPINAACVVGIEYLGYDAIEDKSLIMQKL